ncbi:hypothetical protein [Actinoplanes sp. GCM10030250]|uniref:hypothetical protein n=1 Tax=Actinoplanes sp. GCM10030250 TaxID=3273376 RepID=UPI00360DB766
MSGHTWELHHSKHHVVYVKAATTPSTSWPSFVTRVTNSPWAGWRRAWHSTCPGASCTRSSEIPCALTALSGRTAAAPVSTFPVAVRAPRSSG